MADVIQFIVMNKWWFIALIPIVLVIVVMRIRG